MNGHTPRWTRLSARWLVNGEPRLRGRCGDRGWGRIHHPIQGLEVESPQPSHHTTDSEPRERANVREEFTRWANQSLIQRQKASNVSRSQVQARTWWSDCWFIINRPAAARARSWRRLRRGESTATAVATAAQQRWHLAIRHFGLFGGPVAASNAALANDTVA